MSRRRAHVLSIVAVAAVSLAMGALVATLAAGTFDESKGCQPDVEKCPSFVDWHAGFGPGLRVAGILLVVGLLVVAAVSYLTRPQQSPPS